MSRAIFLLQNDLQRITGDVDLLLEKLECITNRVYNDNGDCTVNLGDNMYEDIMTAYFAVERYKKERRKGHIPTEKQMREWDNAEVQN